MDTMEPIYDFYLSGALSSTGLIENNLSDFQAAAKALRDKGWLVFSPPEDEEPGHDWATYMKRDINHLLCSREIVMLAGWKDSTGANLERDLALSLGLPVRKLKTLLDSDGPGNSVADARLRLPGLPDAGQVMVADLIGQPILDEAARLVTRDRGNQYGPPEQDFETTAHMWTAIFGVDVKPSDVARAMICLKLSRAGWSHKRDNWVDIAGYAACGFRCETGSW